MRLMTSGWKQTACAFGVAALASMPVAMQAQNGHDHAAAEKSNSNNTQKLSRNALLAAVRQATVRYFDVEVAKADGYQLQFGCVSGDSAGAMGMHFVNGALVGDGELDPSAPEIVIYEPLPNGRLRLVGADFLVLADQWNATHSGPPELGGQLLHLFDAPNRFGLPAFYTLHVWAWKDNPTGTFVNWHSNVSCDGFNGDKQ